MISLDQIALWYLLVFGLYIGTDAVVRKGVINCKRVFTILAGVASLIVLAYYMYNMYSTEGMRTRKEAFPLGVEGMRPSMPQRSRTIRSADLVDIHHGNINAIDYPNPDPHPNPMMYPDPDQRVNRVGITPLPTP